jgi:hypothetical protein
MPDLIPAAPSCHNNDEHLSCIMDTTGHEVRRYPGNVLEVRNLDGTEPPIPEQIQVKAWFWRFVALPEPEPTEQQREVVA